MDWYDTIENLHLDVFVSHVPPVHPSLSSFPPNKCYMTDVPFINATHWICGHDHLQGEFDKAGVKFHMNAIGYTDDYRSYRKNTLPSNGLFDLGTGKEFKVRTFEI